MIIFIIYRFKHNTSFVSRFSTIRRHKSPSSHAHSPISRNRFGASSVTDHSANQETFSSRLPASMSQDSVVKENSEASKKNSDGKQSNCNKIKIDNFQNSWSMVIDNELMSNLNIKYGRTFVVNKTYVNDWNEKWKNLAWYCMDVKC